MNAGSLDKRLLAKYGKATPEALVESALWEASLFEEHGFRDFKISVKHNDPVVMVRAYELLSEACDYPLHLGVTEAGPAFQGTIKSAVAFGSLLSRGIGDTIRVSLSAPPVEEVKVGIKILESLNLRPRQLEIVSCPSCGRAQVDVYKLADEVTAGLEGLEVPLRVAVMGCVVNGPGEAREADLGVASGNGKGQIFVRGEVIKTVKESEIVETLIEEAMRLADEMPAGDGRCPPSASADRDHDQRPVARTSVTDVPPPCSVVVHGRRTRRSGCSVATTCRAVRAAVGQPGRERLRRGAGARRRAGPDRSRLPAVGLRAGRRAAIAVSRRLEPRAGERRRRTPSSAWAEFAGRHRTCASIIGPSTTALELWRRLGERWGRAWTRGPQRPTAAAGDGDRRVPPRSSPTGVHRISLEHWDPYYEAAVKMYTEEVGVSPLQGNPAGYRFYVRQLITSGRAFGLIRGGRVVFKADLGSVSGKVCQVQGVWLDPSLRGRGLAAPAMAAVRPAGAHARPDRLAVRQRLQPAGPGDVRAGRLPRRRRVRHHPLLSHAQGREAGQGRYLVDGPEHGGHRRGQSAAVLPPAPSAGWREGRDPTGAAACRAAGR